MNLLNSRKLLTRGMDTFLIVENGMILARVKDSLARLDRKSSFSLVTQFLFLRPKIIRAFVSSPLTYYYIDWTLILSQHKSF
jgi:hypothetical protein